jgi:AcrR family transcriptional regulator
MDKRELIKQSAIKLFSAKGFQATSTTSITTDAGVGTGTLFLYFKSKDEMVNQIYLEVKEELAKYLWVDLSEQRTIRAKFKLIWNRMIDWSLLNPEKYLFIQNFSNSPFINNLTKEEAIGGFRFLFDMINEGIEHDVMNPIDPEFVYYALNGFINGTIMHLMHHPEAKERITEQAFLMVWKSMSV